MAKCPKCVHFHESVGPYSRMIGWCTVLVGQQLPFWAARQYAVLYVDGDRCSMFNPRGQAPVNQEEAASGEAVV